MEIENLFAFKLDAFQKAAMESIKEGKNVLVCAPTGSGKTAIAEYAVHRAIELNKKIFYTTPLKALSNQKFFDLCQAFGQDKVGLLTGDSSVNRDAQILVLTTEIFRNILYNPGEKSQLEDIGFLVLDECHYMKDPDRGTVWEECIIYCPKEAQIIALSATVGNPEEICDWVSYVHGETELIKSSKRPVPLQCLYLGRNGMQNLANKRGNVNKELVKDYFKSKGSQKKNKKSGKQTFTPTVWDAISELHRKDMLPAIYFLFSRKGCELALRRLSESRHANLLNPDEKKELSECLRSAVEEFPLLREHSHYEALEKGIACHHAGLLPSLKNLVEKLFQKGLIKVVFATETLSAGINMPARSTVISQMSKRTDNGHELLTTSQFMQMAGRAGRRGMDAAGYSLVMETPYESMLDIIQIVGGDPENLKSAFTPNYIMSLNLAASYDLERVKELIMLSFARYENARELRRLEKEVNLESSEKKRKRLNREFERLDSIPWVYFERNNKLLERYKYISGDFNLTEKGKWARDLRSENILFFAEVIERELLKELTAFELCGIACAFSSNELRGDRSNSNTTNWGVSANVVSVVGKIYALIKEISERQQELGISANIPFNPELIGLGFDWALMSDWYSLTDKYRTDEGDLVRILKQGSDLLKQLSVCAGTEKTEGLTERAKEGLRLINRSPVRDNLFE